MGTHVQKIYPENIVDQRRDRQIHEEFRLQVIHALCPPVVWCFVCLLYTPLRYHLSSLEDGFPLLLEGHEGLVPVLGGDDALVHFVLDLLPGPRDSLQRGPDGDGASLTDLLGQPDGLGQGTPAGELQQAAVLAAGGLLLRADLDEAVGDAEEVGLGGGDAAAGEDEVAGAREADEGGQAVGAAGAGDDAQAGLGQADGGVGGEDAEVRGQGELEPAAQGQRGDG